jgi:hypothetical protein
MIIGVTPRVNLNRKFMTNVGAVLLLGCVQLTLESKGVDGSDQEFLH